MHQLAEFQVNLPESWHCIDCGMNTAPGLSNKAEMIATIQQLGGLWELGVVGVPQVYDTRTEVYHVRSAIWQRAGVAPFGGCLCIGCLEARIGRRLRPKDFPPWHEFRQMPGTPRLVSRRGEPSLAARWVIQIKVDDAMSAADDACPL